MEGYDEATYGDRMADTYDDWYADLGDLDGCIERLDALARAVGGDRPIVVELGIGTGRIAVPLAARGLDVRGIDASAAMIERLAEKAGGDAIAVAVGDMAATEPPRRRGEAEPFTADLVFVAYNTFFNVPTDEAQAAVLARVRTWLPPGGRFVLDAFVPDVESSDAAVAIRTLEVDRVVLSAAKVDDHDQTMSGQYIDITESGVRLRPWHLHYQSPAQLDAMAAAAGLVLDERWSTWRADPFDAASSHHVSVYRPR